MKKNPMVWGALVVTCTACTATTSVNVGAQASTSVALVASAPGGLAGAVGGTSVTQERRIDTNNIQYLVRQATGPDQASAERVALSGAVVQAARELTDDTAERQRLASHVTANLARYAAFGSRAGGEDAVAASESNADGSLTTIAMHVLVNIGEVRRQLETDGAFQSNAQMSNALGAPTIMVLNRDLMRDPSADNTEAGTIIDTSIQAFLTQQQWNLVDREALRAAAAQRSAIEGVTGMGTDPAADLAAMAGADMYFVYTVQLERGGVVSATVSLTAHDTATAQQLGASIGRSRQYPAGAILTDVVSEATNNGMRDLLSNVRGYWQQAAREGRRYRIAVRGDFSNTERRRAIRDVVRGLGRPAGDITLTQNTISCVLVSQRAKDEIQDAIEDACTHAGFANVQVGVSSRSLIMINAQ